MAGIFSITGRLADMGVLKHFLQVPKIKGVARYILADRNGEVVIHNMKGYKNKGSLISFCTEQAWSIGRGKVHYLVFTRRSGEDLFIFPVGNYSLGVVKEKDIQTVELISSVLEFLNGLDIKRS